MISCTCGLRMYCRNTRNDGETVIRRYHCACGRRVSTLECVVGDQIRSYLRGSEQGKEIIEKFRQFGKDTPTDKGEG